MYSLYCPLSWIKMCKLLKRILGSAFTLNVYIESLLRKNWTSNKEQMKSENLKFIYSLLERLEKTEQQLYTNFTEKYYLFFFSFRCSCHKKWSNIWMLPWALFRYNLYNQDQAKDTILFLQSHCTMCTHCFNGCTGLHTSPRFRRKTISW